MESNRPYIIAITGGIGCGKTTVCNLIQEKGYYVFDTDCFSVEAIKTQIEVRDKLKELIPNQSIFINRQLDFKTIGSFFDQNPDIEIEFEQWFQPVLGQLIKKELLEIQGCDIIFADVPKIVEKKLLSIFDEIWVITASQTHQRKRIESRNHYAVNKIEILLNSCTKKYPLSSKFTVIRNDDSIDQLDKLIEEAIHIAKSNSSVLKVMYSFIPSICVTKPCPDIVIGRIEKGRWKLWASVDERSKNKSNLEISNSTNEKTIVIILESPHIEEFIESAEKKKSIDFYEKHSIVSSPALSNTGSNLQKYLQTLLSEKINSNLTYRIILMNSIQYQCSLGYKTSKWRDHVWLRLWFDEKMNKNFVHRLKEYKPDIVINCCTKGNHKHEPQCPYRTKTVINKVYLDYCIKTKGVQGNSLKEFVQYEIDTNFNSAERYSCSHPSSWHETPKLE